MAPLFYICILLPPLVTGLIGFDCGGHGLNITILSLLDIGDCELAEIETSAEETYVQLAQLSDYDKTRVHQCKVEVDRTIFYCAMHSHISVVQNGRRVYPVKHRLSNTACQRLHKTDTLSIGGSAIISRASPNSTTTSISINLAGSMDYNGRCSGTQYSDPYGTWDTVVVQATIKIILGDFEVPIERASSHLILPSSQRCDAR